MVSPPRQKDTVLNVIKAMPVGTVFTMTEIADTVNKNHKRWEVTSHELPHLISQVPYCKVIKSERRRDPIRYVRIEPELCPSCGLAMCVLDGFGLWCNKCRVRTSIPEATA